MGPAVVTQRSTNSVGPRPELSDRSDISLRVTQKIDGKISIERKSADPQQRKPKFLLSMSVEALSSRILDWASLSFVHNDRKNNALLIFLY